MLCYAYSKGKIIGRVTAFEVHAYKMKCSNQKGSKRYNRDNEHEHTKKKTRSEEMHEYTISRYYPALTMHYAIPLCKCDTSLKRIKFLETSCFWKADNRPVNKKISHILWNPKVPPYFYHNRPAKLNLKKHLATNVQNKQRHSKTTRSVPNTLFIVGLTVCR
jgi:hypothetical protein